MNDTKDTCSSHGEVIQMAVDVVAAYVGRNQVPAQDLPDLITTVFTSLNTLNGQAGQDVTHHKPMVPVKKSVTPDYLICLEDGKKLKMLKRHLRTNYNMTPEEYRAKWNLPPEYPMVAPNYAAQRSSFAKKIGLGKNTTNDEEDNTMQQSKMGQQSKVG
jgi:predicted transcriptional regulator